MQTGLDRLLRFHRKWIQGKRVALLAHPAAVDKHLRHALEVLQEEASARVVALFGPEHGIHGQAQDMESVVGSTYRGIPVYSLYGHDEASLKPTRESLKDVEVLICDLQDVGARYYTFIYTIAFCMEVAKETGTKVVVLDRPNPINGHQVEGNLVAPGFRSFVGWFPLAARHGMTVGELAQMFRHEFDLKCDLEVVTMKGWHRRRCMDELDTPWVLPSPNMPTVDTAVVYPGMCLVEGTELSEGRGTTRPFEFFGAPYVDPEALVRRLREFRLPGVRFRPIYFKPGFQKHAGQTCGGAQLHVTRRKAFKSLLTGVAALKAVHDLYPQEFQFRHRAYEFVDKIPAIDLLAGNAKLRTQLEKGASLQEIEGSWEDERQAFLETRKKYLLYT
ncbi:DUF1343 domain-containing protein [Deltaproteobacteria bacterium PRO3]|nr:DUF1343 domain-containing protein [Deltaproteobacteria bacterium PRO3]